MICNPRRARITARSIPERRISPDQASPPPSAAFVRQYLLAGGWRYGRNCLASLAKIAIGRPPHFSADNVLFRQVVRQRLGLGRINSVTSAASPREGAGSHALMAMRAIAFARRTGLTYVHTPLAGIHHADRPTPAWEAAWETLFNLGDGEARSDGDPVNYALTFADLHALFGFDGAPAFDRPLLEDFRRKYRANKLPRQASIFTVGVHLRRRNANDFHADEVADLPRLARTVSAASAMMERLGIAWRLRIFSQGAMADFDVLGVAADSLNLDTDPVETMAALVDSDLLVVTGGTFSHVAGLLCEGVVLADAGIHPSPPPGWHLYDAAGRFDVDAVRGAIGAIDASARARP